MYRRVVVPLDGSDIAELALVEAEALASLMDAPIHLVRVVDTADSLLYVDRGRVADSAGPSVLLADEVESVRQYLDSVATRIANQGARVSHELRCGSVVGELISASQPGDLYVMASHGRSGLRRWFLGSVAEDVVRQSRVPVLLVRSTAPAAATVAQSGGGLERITGPAATPQWKGTANV